MTIRSKSILCILAALALLLGGAAPLMRQALLTRFLSLERDLLIQDMARAQQTLRNELRVLTNLTHDWATWNASYEFMASQGEERELYINENFGDDPLATNEMHVALFLEPGGAIFFGAGYDPLVERRMALPQGLLRVIQNATVLATPPAEGLQGLLPLPEGLLLLASKPVLTSDGHGPPRGALLIGRFLHAGILEKFRERAQLDMRLEPLPGDALQLLASAANGEDMAVEEGENSIVAWRPLTDLLGQRSQRLVVTKNRAVLEQGRQAIRWTFAALLAGGGLLGVALFLLLETRLLSRVRSLSTQARRIASAGEGSQQVYCTGSDEVAAMASSINAMLASLERARQEQAAQMHATQEEERFLQQMLDSLQVGVLLLEPETRRVLAANAFALRLMGQGREELVGQVCHGLFGPAPEEQTPAPFQAAQAGASVLEFTGADGAKVPILMRETTIVRRGKPVLLATFMDIADLQAAQERLRLSEETYRALFTSAVAAMARLDRQGVVILANEQFLRLVGQPRERVQGHMTWRELLRPEDHEAVQALLDSLVVGGDAEHSLDAVLRRGDGETRRVAVTAAPLPMEGEHVLSFVDVTQRHESEQALQAAHDHLEDMVAARTQELKNAVARLEELDGLKTSFLSSASHELRTPLTSIMGFAKLMERSFTRNFQPLAATDALKDKAREHLRNLRILQQEGERLTRLVNDLLDINAIESGIVQWRDAPTRLDKILREVAETMRADIAANPNLALMMDVPSDLPEIQVDPDRMLQVFHGLVSNAVKFTPSGTVSISARMLPSLNMLEVRVRDTGQGIAPEALPRIFEKFYQAHPAGDDMDALRDKPRGAGLGLALCREIVEHYSGEILVESTLGRGSVFVVRLPVKDAYPVEGQVRA